MTPSLVRVVAASASVNEIDAILTLSKFLMGRTLSLFLRTVSAFSVNWRLISSDCLSLMSSIRFWVLIGVNLSSPTHAFAVNTFFTRVSISAWEIRPSRSEERRVGKEC